MPRKFALPVGFAVVVVLAVVGVLSALGGFSFTAADYTEASNLPAGDLTLGERNAEGFNPFVATTPISGVLTVAAFPNEPGALASYTFVFVAPHDLANGVDEIIITLHNDFVNFPTVIATSAVSISASAVSNSPPGTPGQVVAPEEVSVDFVTPTNADPQPQIKLRVPDMDTVADTGGNGIAAGAFVTVIFRQAAGITNPTENNTYTINLRVTDGSGVDGGTSDDTTGEIFIQALLAMSNDSGTVGSKLKVEARGIEGKESVTFFLDVDGDGIRDQDERDLCTVVGNSDDTATCIFILNDPPFQPGTGSGSCQVADIGTAAFSCNFINFVGSENRNTTGSTGDALDQQAVDRQTFDLVPGSPPPTPTPTPSPTPAPPSVALSVPNLSGGPAGTEVRVAGFNFNPFLSVRITFDDQLVASVNPGSIGSFSVTFIVPDVPPGNYQIVVGDAEPLPFVVTPTIHACFTNHKTAAEKQGQLRIVSDPANCTQNETPISWNK